MSNPLRERDNDSWLSVILSCVILLGGMITVGLSAYMVVTSHSQLPWSDGWIQIFRAADQDKTPLPVWLWRQHNEHRLVLPKLFLLADLHWFHARQVSLLTSIFVIQFLHWVLLTWSMRVLGGWRGPLWRTGVGVAAFCLFCPTQWENLIWGFQTCFVLPCFLATLSFVSLLLYRDRSAGPAQAGSGKFLGLSLVAALAATYSLANGNLLWPLLLAAALLLRLRFAAVSYALAGAVSTCLYLYEYVRPLQSSNPATDIRNPARLFEYVTTYFGSSWVRQSIPAAIWIGVAGLLLALALLWRARPASGVSNAFPIQLSLTLGFCLGTALITALGRVNAGLGQAFSSRYQTVALLFWCCVALLALSLLAAVQGSRMIAVQLMLIVIFAGGAGRARFPLRDARETAFQLNAAGAALLNNVDDAEQLARAFPQPDAIVSVAALMRREQLSVFSGNASASIGLTLALQFTVTAPEKCAGAVQSINAIPGAGSAVRLAGWAWELDSRQPPSYIVVVSNGVIVGLGALGDWRPAIRAADRFLKTSFVGFTAYAKEFPRNQPLNIYAVSRGNSGKACLLASVEASALPATHSEVK